MFETVDQHEIIMISNFSETLDEYLYQVSQELSKKNLETTILVYRKSSLPNTKSYEEFLENNYEVLMQLDPFEFHQELQGVNFMLPVVAERLFSNYNHLKNTLGSRYIAIDDINFFMMSWTYFIYPYIKNSKIVFGGYADNAISTLTYHLASNCHTPYYTFHGLAVAGGGLQYIIDALYGNLVIGYKTDFLQQKNTQALLDYDVNRDLKELADTRKNVRPPLFGVISGNVSNVRHWYHALRGYKTKNHSIRRFMNVDRPSLYHKLRANMKRLKNKICVNLYFALKSTIELQEYDYVYFPLQLQPEASTNARSPYHANQLAVIENISKSLPLGYYLFVKEHPLGVGMRDTEYYRYIDSLPNVKILPFRINGKEVLKQCKLLVSPGGTTNFEAIALGVKAILLDKFFYMESKLIKYVPNDKELPKAIWEMLNLEVSENEKKEEHEKLVDLYCERAMPIIQPFQHIANALYDIVSQPRKTP